MSCITIEALIAAKEAELEVLRKYQGAGEENPAETAKGKKGKADDKEKPAEGRITGDYENASSKGLYKECCDRGISSKCKERNKAFLIKVLKEDDAGKSDVADDDDWNEDETEVDPYEGKKASELYKMCVERKIKTKKQLKASDYAKLLRKYDEEQAKASVAEEYSDEDDWDEAEDDWEV